MSDPSGKQSLSIRVWAAPADGELTISTTWYVVPPPSRGVLTNISSGLACWCSLVEDSSVFFVWLVALPPAGCPVSCAPCLVLGLVPGLVWKGAPGAWCP